MRIKTIPSFLLIALFALSAGLSAAEVRPALKNALDRFPAGSSGDRTALAAELLAMGKPALLELCGLLVAPGQGDDLKARYALSALAFHVGRPGAGAAEGPLLTEALTEALTAATDDEVKDFLLTQLHLAGREQAIPVLAGYLLHDRLCDPAIRALLALRTPDAEEALRRALPKASGKPRVALLQALGQFGDSKAGREIARHVRSEDRDTRLAALDALARLGPAPRRWFRRNPDTEKLLTEAMQSASGFEQAKVLSYYFRYLSRAVEAGETKQAAAACRKLIAGHPQDEYIQCHAAALLVSAVGPAAQADLLALATTGGRQARAGALRLAEAMPGEAVTAAWAEKAATGPADLRADILAMLGRRRDPAAFPAIEAGLKDSDAAVRQVAVKACSDLGGARGLGLLLTALRTAPADEAVKQALARLPGEEATKALAAALQNPPAEAQAALLEVLALRGGDATSRAALLAHTEAGDPAVRLAALKSWGVIADEKDLPRLARLLASASVPQERAVLQKSIVAVGALNPDANSRATALLEVLPGAPKENRIAILGILPELGGASACAAVEADSNSSDADIRDAAVRALANWKADGAIDGLLRLATGAEKPAHRVLATQGLLRLVAASGRPAAEKATLLAKALEAGGRPEEKKLLVDALVGLRQPESFLALAKGLEDKDIQAEAARGVALLACPQNDQDPGLVSAEAGQALTAAKAFLTDEGLRARVEAQLKKIPVPEAAPTPSPSAPTASDEEGFQPLFNGKDMTGWIGDTKGYVAEDGRMICKPGGNVFTEAQYDNFILRFEFKLTSGANNGLGIRAPTQGDPAYAGMEIQILDDTADQYKNLQPYQFHGSIYGLVPARRGHLKPVGEWNSQEVIADGPRIKVTLNGAVIVDAELDKIEQTDKIHNLAQHPGRLNKSGHIGFLGHGSVVEFRNIRLKKLGSAKP